MSGAYSLPNALAKLAPIPVEAQKAPAASDIAYPLGQIWIDESAGNGYLLTDKAGGSATCTFDLDDAISLATSVTSPIYTTSAADMNIIAGANQDILIQMGDDAGAQKVSFEDSGFAEVASIDSDGGLLG